MELDIYISIDESGVLHKNSGDNYFTYGGVLIIGKEEKQRIVSKYRRVELEISSSYRNAEIKGSNISTKHKNSLFRIVKPFSFGCTMEQRKIYNRIYNDKKTIQRFKDYCIVRSIKNALENSAIDTNKCYRRITVNVMVDQQNISTKGLYNLEESLREELFFGKYSNSLIPPIFTNIDNTTIQVFVKYKDSQHDILVRKADIVANNLFYSANNNKHPNVESHLLLP